jgi:ribosomal RNA adenine dimethylase
MAAKSEALTRAISERLLETCRQILEEITLAPSIEIGDIDLEVLRSPRFDSEKPTTSYVITVNTNDATMVRGAVASYKGSYKERIEAVLDHVVREVDPNGHAYVNISGPESETVDRLLSIRSLVDAKKLLPTAPIVRTAKENGIDYVQVRGRHLIAPSPAIADFIEQYVFRHPDETRTVADLFAGTAVATRVLLRRANPQKIVVIDNDPQKIRRIRKQLQDSRVTILQGDALRWSIGKFDLAIADPYYEDVFEFVDKQIENIRRKVRVLILVPGNVEDRTWNASVQERLESSHFTVFSHEMYGQVILEAKPKSKLFR